MDFNFEREIWFYNSGKILPQISILLTGKENLKICQNFLSTSYIIRVGKIPKNSGNPNSRGQDPRKKKTWAWRMQF